MQVKKVRAQEVMASEWASECLTQLAAPLLPMQMYFEQSVPLQSIDSSKEVDITDSQVLLKFFQSKSFWSRVQSPTFEGCHRRKVSTTSTVHCHFGFTLLSHLSSFSSPLLSSHFGSSSTNCGVIDDDAPVELIQWLSWLSLCHVSSAPFTLIDIHSADGICICMLNSWSKTMAVGRWLKWQEVREDAVLRVNWGQTLTDLPTGRLRPLDIWNSQLQVYHTGFWFNIQLVELMVLFCTVIMKVLLHLHIKVSSNRAR